MNPGVFAHWPNRITAMRFVGAMVLFAVLAIWGEGQETVAETSTNPIAMHVAFWLFLATSLSDILDGYLARKGNQITAFGRIADPFVDKVLVLGTMIFLLVLPWSREMFPAWVVVVILAREFLVTGIRGYVESVGGQFPADWFGKLKMTFQCIAIGVVLGLAAIPFPDWFEGPWWIFGEICVWVTLVTAVGSGISYVLKTRKVLQGIKT
jgi:CDP-diacylglycerol--glycerol-3-phosphate 3-phosphatidyltransferase